MTSNLSDYNDLLDWALNAHRLADTPTEQSRKRSLLHELNGALGTRYTEPHLNNWLAGRKPTPGRVRDHLTAALIDTEIGFDNPELSRELIRILGLPNPVTPPET